MFFFVDMIKYLKVIKSGIVQIFYQKATEGLVQQRLGVMAGDVLRRNICAIFEVFASYEHLW